MTQNNLIAILDIVPSPINDREESLWGFNIESPKQGTQTATNKIWFVGWVLGKKAPAVAVDVISSGTVIYKITFNQQRGDVAEIYPDVPGVENCGFAAEVVLNELPAEAELILQAVFSELSSVPLAVVRVGQRPPRWKQIQTDLERSRTRLQQIQAELVRSQSQLHKIQK
jgi:hypothetical protein